MKLKMLKIFRLYLLFLAIIGWISIFVIMALYTYELLTFNTSIIWGIVSVLCLLPVGATLYQYFFFDIAFGRIQKNIEDLRDSQKFCYTCGKEIVSQKTLTTCPECNSNLNILEFLLKI